MSSSTLRAEAPEFYPSYMYAATEYYEAGSEVRTFGIRLAVLVLQWSRPAVWSSLMSWDVGRVPKVPGKCFGSTSVSML